VREAVVLYVFGRLDGDVLQNRGPASFGGSALVLTNLVKATVFGRESCLLIGRYDLHWCTWMIKMLTLFA